MTPSVDDIIDERLRAGCEWIDAWIVDEMRTLVLAAGDRVHRPPVAAAIDAERERLERWRDQKLDELHAALLRGLGRLN
jgi:hypothetical protein